MLPLLLLLLLLSLSGGGGSSSSSGECLAFFHAWPLWHHVCRHLLALFTAVLSLFVLDICSDLYAMPRQLGTCVVRRRAKCMYCCTAVMYAYVRIYVAQQSPNDLPVKHHNT